MDLMAKITELLLHNPNGLKASAMATKIGLTRHEVNSFLYSNKSTFQIDDNYIWTLKNKPEAAPVPQPVPVAKRVATTSSRARTTLPPRAAIHQYAYCSTVDAFLSLSESQWIEEMESGFSRSFQLPLGGTQIGVWKDCFKVLQRALPDFNDEYPNFHIVFEYALPYESGRRPDVVLVSEEFLIILEFKKKNAVLRSDVDQTAAYLRDMEEYHFESRNKNISALLVVTEMTRQYYDEDTIAVVSGDLLYTALTDCVAGDTTKCDIDTWLHSKYEPLPTIVEAAKMFVKKEELPNIRRVNSTCIPQAIDCLNNISAFAKNNKKHVVAFVTGVPGAGKTFLGLKYVYDICDDYSNVNSVYLSGNGPLVSVLTDALHSSVFVKDLHKVVIQYITNGAHDFNNNIIVFDEGQRAWDKRQMFEKRNTTKSEPDIMVELCARRLDWCVLLVLVGEGQEIHNGENSGIAQWNTAIQNSDVAWDVLCPEKLDSVFAGRKLLQNDNRNALNLSQSLRTHLAGDVSNFANALISGDIEKAKVFSQKVKESGFPMYVTRDLAAAKTYLRQRYKGEPSKRYGMIASSKGNILRRHGMDNSFQGSVGMFYVGKWFNAEADDHRSCCALTSVATEFSCQGLEIDMPLIGWDSDMQWDGCKWKKFKMSEPEDSDANTYRKNSYRVLLTRGRDGFVIFVPDEETLDSVYYLLNEVGVEEL